MFQNIALFQRNGIPSRKKYTWGKTKNITWAGNDTSVDPQTLFMLATYNFTEIVKRISVHFMQADKNGNTETDIDLEDNFDSIKEQRHRNFGRCYTFYPARDIRDLGVEYIMAYL